MGVLTLVFYAPALLVVGWRGMTSNPVYVRLPLDAFVRQFCQTLPGTWHLWHRDIPFALQAVLLIGFVLALADRGEAAHRRRLLVVAVPAFLAPVLLVQRMVPFPRIWVFLWPVYLMLGISGLHFALGLMLKRRLKYLVAPLTLSLGLITSATVLGRRAEHVNEYGHFHDGKEVASFLASYLEPGDRLVAVAPANMPLRYYLARLGVDEGPMFLPLDRAKRLVVVVNQMTGGAVQLPEEVVENAKIPRERFGQPVLVRRFPYSAVYEMRPAIPH